MALTAARNAPKRATLATTLTRIDPGDGVRFVWLSCDADVYVVYSATLTDGGTVPADDRFRVPANVTWPAEVVPGRRLLVAATTGTPELHVMGTAGVAG
jgi:hypothetical protein